MTHHAHFLWVSPFFHTSSIYPMLPCPLLDKQAFLFPVFHLTIFILPIILPCTLLLKLCMRKVFNQCTWNCWKCFIYQTPFIYLFMGYICVHIHVCASVWGPEVSLGFLCYLFSTWFFKKMVCVTAWNTSVWLGCLNDRLARDCQGSACLHLPSPEIMCVCHGACHFNMGAWDMN